MYYLLSDHLGSTTTVLNTSGGVVSTQKYYPYGRTRSGSVGTDKQFTGYQREQDDLYFMQARFYDPFVGRFLAPDTIVPDPANPQALNRYSYVLGTPPRGTPYPFGSRPVDAQVCGLPTSRGLIGGVTRAGCDLTGNAHRLHQLQTSC